MAWNLWYDLTKHLISTNKKYTTFSHFYPILIPNKKNVFPSHGLNGAAWSQKIWLKI